MLRHCFQLLIELGYSLLVSLGSSLGRFLEQLNEPEASVVPFSAA